jgi:lipid II:glycine glycyltransferase (peptidoglycan interpeptide bridge formation enzyme)
MHFEAMKEAKKRNCLIYDFLAVAPSDWPSNAPAHPYAGLSRFKTQFGGEMVRLLGSWDLINKPVWYKMYRFVERRRRGVSR